MLTVMMKTPERVDAIARTVVEHHQENVAPMGFKAFLMAVDREVCTPYKAALDKYLPRIAVFSSTPPTPIARRSIATTSPPTSSSRCVATSRCPKSNHTS